jgi:hypothetical protein
MSRGRAQRQRAVRCARDSGEATARVMSHVLQAFAQGLGLGFADRRKRNVDLALVAAFGVPRRFAVTGKQDAHVGVLRWFVAAPRRTSRGRMRRRDGGMKPAPVGFSGTSRRYSALLWQAQFLQQLRRRRHFLHDPFQ